MNLNEQKRMNNKILITPRGYAKYGITFRKELENAGFEVDWNDTEQQLPKKVFEEKLKEAIGAIIGVEDCNRELLQQCKQLKSIVKFGIGIDNIDQETCKELGIQIGRCVGTNSNAVAELTMGLVFACARSIVSNAIYVKNGNWKKQTGIELYGKKIGIVGFGNVGKNVARIANGIGMKVYCYDVFEIDKEELKKHNTTYASFNQIIRDCDVITLHVPLTEETRNMIAGEEFKKMKKDSILVNAARGGIIDEFSIYNALKNNEIAAVASDVWTTEPPKDEKWVLELLSMDNFILTAHIASRSKEAEIKTIERSTNIILEHLL